MTVPDIKVHITNYLYVTDNFIAEPTLLKPASRTWWSPDSAAEWGWEISYLTGNFTDDDNGIRAVFTAANTESVADIMLAFERRLLDSRPLSMTQKLARLAGDPQ